MKYYYYKYGNSYAKYKTPVDKEGFIKITELEYTNAISNSHKPTNTNSEIKKQIASLKSQLAKTDYQAIKYAEGWFSEEEYAPIKASRQAIRDQINELEGKLY